MYFGLHCLSFKVVCHTTASDLFPFSFSISHTRNLNHSRFKYVRHEKKSDWTYLYKKYACIVFDFFLFPHYTGDFLKCSSAQGMVPSEKKWLSVSTVNISTCKSGFAEWILILKKYLKYWTSSPRRWLDGHVKELTKRLGTVHLIFRGRGVWTFGPGREIFFGQNRS